MRNLLSNAARAQRRRPRRVLERRERPSPGVTPYLPHEQKGFTMDVQRAGIGVVAGVAGGIVFGTMMQMMGMMGMIAGLAGQSSAAVGWVVHIGISAVLGAGFGLTFGPLSQSWVRSVMYGIAYGVAWWILGALILMPMMMGMPIAEIEQMQMQSLVGHVVFGAVTGLVFNAVLRRSEQTRQGLAA